MTWYPKSVVRATVGRRRTELAMRRVPLYGRVSAQEAVDLQLGAANRVWEHAWRTSAFYGHLKQEHHLPDQLDGLERLADFPVVDKELLRNSEDLVWEGHDRWKFYVTGGSTGTPTRFPKGSGELDATLEGVGCYREHWGILPFDRYLYVGGAAHQLTSGKHAGLRRADRLLRDRLVNGGRIDGWSTRDEELADSIAVFQRFRPEFLVGFPSKILRIAEYAEANDVVFRDLRRIILSSENVSAPEVERIEQAFGARVLLEYGSEEVGLVAASWDSTWPMRVMFDSVLVRTNEETQALITTLSPRAFPLINYSLGDHIRPGETMQGSILTIDEVMGRSREQVAIPLADGRQASSMPLALIVILKQRPGVLAVQFHQPQDGHLDLYVQLAPSVELNRVREELADGLHRLHQDVDLSRVRIGAMEGPELTSRQKLRVVLDSPPSRASGPLLSLSE